MMAKILEPTPSNIRLIASHLRQGGIAAMPTETVYGLAGSARDAGALARIFKVKERPVFDPLIVHLPSSWISDQQPLRMLAQKNLIDEKKIPKNTRIKIEALIKNFWPGPLTLVLPKSVQIPDLTTSGLPTVALRVPSLPVTQLLLEECQLPLAAPSANRFGKISPTSAQNVNTELGDRIEFILDGGESAIGVESTVLAFQENGSALCLRPGGVALENISRVLGEEIRRTGQQDQTGALPSPGLLPQHYAPKTPLMLLTCRISEWSQSEHPGGGRFGLLLFSSQSEALIKKLFSDSAWVIRVLSRDENDEEAARNLFKALRELDESGVDRIIAEAVPGKQGLWLAIEDRLMRAQKQT